jgi:hypothetical protein
MAKQAHLHVLRLAVLLGQGTDQRWGRQRADKQRRAPARLVHRDGTALAERHPAQPRLGHQAKRTGLTRDGILLPSRRVARVRGHAQDHSGDESDEQQLHPTGQAASKSAIQEGRNGSEHTQPTGCRHCRASAGEKVERVRNALAGEHGVENPWQNSLAPRCSTSPRKAEHWVSCVGGAKHVTQHFLDFTGKISWNTQIKF